MDRTRHRQAVGLTVSLVLALVAPATSAAASPDERGGDKERVRAIVTFDRNPDRASERAVEKLEGKVRRHLDLINGLSIELPRGQLKNLERSAGVRHVELDHKLTAFDHAGGTGDLEYENAWGVEHIGTRPVHLGGNTGQGIKLAVIDTGLDYIHDDPDNVPYVVDPEFTSNYAGGYDFVNNDNDPMDDNGHGTHVSGIVAAQKNNYLVVGVAPGVQLYALKVLGATGEGDYSGLIAALDWAVTNDIDVVNMSLGGHEVSAALQTAVANASAAGLTLVAASGNVNPNNFNELLYGCPVAYPAAYEQVIAVSFTNTSDKLTGFSCTGPQVDMAAPGDQIFSTVPVGTCMFCKPQGYAANSGTSMAAPHVAGVAALILAAGIANGGDPATLHDDVKAHICATTTQANMAITDPKYPSYYGCGIANARKALIETPPPSPINTNAPVAADDAVTTDEDTPVDVAVLANDTDPNGDALSVTAATDPAHGTTSVQPDGTVRYAPDPDYAGADAFDYTVDDGTANTDTGSVAVTVRAVNDDPTAVDDVLVTISDAAGSVAVLANDSDVDGDTIAVSGVTTPANGSTTIELDGSITYQPADGYVGDDGFDYTIDDGAGGTATGHVSVTVVFVNAPPVAVDDVATVAEDGSALIDVLANDTVADGGALTVVAVGQPAHGSTAISSDGTVSYVPVANYNGLDAFDYTVADSIGFTDTGTVAVAVTAVNDAPVAVADSAATAEDAPATIAVTANDTDVDGDTLTLIAVSAADIGSSAIAPDGTIVYTPPPNYFGADAFSYTVSDGQGGTASAAVSVSISSVNDIPTAAMASATTKYQTATTVTLSGSDVETCNLTFQIVTPPAHGTLGYMSAVMCATLLVPYSDSAKTKYTPAAGWSGMDQFTYRTSDGTQWSPPATVTVTTSPPVMLHVGDLDGVKTVQTSTWTVKVTIRVHDGAEASMSGVTILGVWSGVGISGTGTCKTNSSGVCTVPKTQIPKTTTSVTFTVTGLTFTPTGIYEPSANHDPEADSNGTAITVVGP
jgi:subtilisin family serine protease